MIYVTSDLHGLELTRLQALLKKVNFSENDVLYILGDVIDRENDGGIEILQWLLLQTNVQLLRGNHEAMLLSREYYFDDTVILTPDQKEELENYILDGGGVTLKALDELREKSPKTFSDIMEYLRKTPIYKTVTAGGKEYILCHSGIDEFSEDMSIEDYPEENLLWAWPEISDEYYDDVTTVFGHTPTMSYNNKYKGRILRTRTWIDIDVGVPYGNPPVLLRLDDLKEFYL